MANQIEKLNAQVAEYFATHPNTEVVYGTADGNLFALKNKRDAEEHARRNKLELHEFSKETAATEKTQKQTTDTGAQIPESDKIVNRQTESNGKAKKK